MPLRVPTTRMAPIGPRGSEGVFLHCGHSEDSDAWDVSCPGAGYVCRGSGARQGVGDEFKRCRQDLDRYDVAWKVRRSDDLGAIPLMRTTFRSLQVRLF